jgi:hypothetical protein
MTMQEEGSKASGGVCRLYAAGTPARLNSSGQAARRTAAANAISAVPTSTIAASSRRPGSGTRTCSTASAGAGWLAADGSLLVTGAAAAIAAQPAKTRDATKIRNTGARRSIRPPFEPWRHGARGPVDQRPAWPETPDSLRPLRAAADAVTRRQITSAVP